MQALVAAIGAAQAGDLGTVPELIANDGTLLNSREVTQGNPSGGTPLMCCVESGKTALVMWFIESGADVNSQNNKGETALMIACEGGPRDIIQTLAERSNLDLRDQLGRSALMKACSSLTCTPDDIQILITAGENVNSQDESGTTVLAHLFSQRGGPRELEIATMLLDSGARSSINVKNNVNASPLSLACSLNIQAVKFLVDNGAQVDQTLIDNCNNENIRGYLGSDIVQARVFKYCPQCLDQYYVNNCELIDDDDDIYECPAGHEI